MEKKKKYCMIIGHILGFVGIKGIYCIGVIYGS